MVWTELHVVAEFGARGTPPKCKTFAPSACLARWVSEWTAGTTMGRLRSLLYLGMASCSVLFCHSVSTSEGIDFSPDPTLEPLRATIPTMAFLWITLTITLAALTHCQTFNLLHSYRGLDFFNRGFTLYEGFDPTFGYVDYVSRDVAEQHGLVNITQVGNTGVARWGVDTIRVLDPNANLGRMSLRLQSVATYTHGLFVLDVKHLPSNVWVISWSPSTLWRIR